MSVFKILHLYFAFIFCIHILTAGFQISNSPCTLPAAKEVLDEALHCCQHLPAFQQLPFELPSFTRLQWFF